jgi:AGZA family xanthine/uracil permease-like MFS transporter
VGIGLFLTFIGLHQTGIVASSDSPSVPVKVGDLHDTRVLLATFGFLVTVVLLQLRVRGAILLGIVITATLGTCLGLAEVPEKVVALPFTGKYDLGEIALAMDFVSVLKLSFLPVLLTLFLMSFLDTLGTLVGVGAMGGMLDEKGNFPRIEKPMLVDAVTCMFSAAVGTSTSGAYIESATGIREGARTGLAAVVTAILFAASLFFIPLIEPLQHLNYAYGPALIVVGILMTHSIQRIRFDDLTELVPALTTIAMMVFTYNIGNGLTAGLVVYPVLKLATGRFRDLNTGSVVLGILCAVYFIFGLPH